MAGEGRSAAFMKALRKKYHLGEFSRGKKKKKTKAAGEYRLGRRIGYRRTDNKGPLYTRKKDVPLGGYNLGF